MDPPPPSGHESDKRLTIEMFIVTMCSKSEHGWNNGAESSLNGSPGRFSFRGTHPCFFAWFHFMFIIGRLPLHVTLHAPPNNTPYITIFNTTISTFWVYPNIRNGRFVGAQNFGVKIDRISVCGTPIFCKIHRIPCFFELNLCKMPLFMCKFARNLSEWVQL